MPAKRQPSAELVVRELGTRKEVHRVNVAGQSERGIERVMMGMLRNMSERFYIDDSEALAAMAAERKERTRGKR